jgi:hypothetical protein
VQIRLLSATKVAEDLAAGRVSAYDQALYLALGFCVWNAAYYLFIIPSSVTEGPFYWWTWSIEFFFVILLNLTGVMFCLRKCRTSPKKNFLIFFICLYLPVSLSTLAIIWGAFHLIWTLPFWLLKPPMPEWILLMPWLGSLHAYDVVRLFGYVGTVFVIYLRIGAHMERLSTMQESASSGCASPSD